LSESDHDSERGGTARLSGDEPCPSVAVSEPTRLGSGFRTYHRFEVQMPNRSGATLTLDRELARVGDVVGILPIDPTRNEVILARQFRFAGHLALSRGAMVEIPAGRVERGESAEAAARRECLEEIGVTPQALRKVLCFMPAPAVCDEVFTLFAASVDASTAPEWAGCTEEDEEIAVLRLDIEAALRLAKENLVHGGPTLLALQWLALNQASLPALLADEAYFAPRFR
jgi:ADP-ribose diphosphatase